jgi:hypothetical protein
MTCSLVTRLVTESKRGFEMKSWLTSKKTISNHDDGALAGAARLARKAISDDLMAQILGGEGKGGCHPPLNLPPDNADVDFHTFP